MDFAENSKAMQLLRELDERQDQVLSELDELNSRVEKVLELYLGARRPTLDSVTSKVVAPEESWDSETKAA